MANRETLPTGSHQHAGELDAGEDGTRRACAAASVPLVSPAPRESQPPARRRRILFVAEAATLAHVARPAVLIASLAPQRYEVCLACAPRYDHLLDVSCRRRPIRSIPSERFLEALAKGSPLYDAATLRSYVEEDLAVLAEFQPDVVVGDFRLSLSVSARLHRVPYVTISNAYWSPYARLRYPLPEIAPVRWLGVGLGTCVFRAIRPLAFAYHTRPLNRVRREFGLPSLGLDLRRVYTDADYTLYADIPGLVPLPNAPSNHAYLGPLVWSPRSPLPTWWHELPEGRPLVYVTLGSSGQADLLPEILKALGDLDVTVMAATAGRVTFAALPGNIYVADFLPGEEAAKRASLVVCNGGGPTTQQALVHGKPVLGIPSNLDQYLNMEATCRAGAGRLVRSGQATAAVLRAALEDMLNNTRYQENAARLGVVCQGCDTAARFEAVLQKTVARFAPA